MKTFSVIMPVYNVEKFVAEAIDSVLMQSFENFELIIIDDCGSDNSLAICQSYQDSRIRIIRHSKNRGLAAARNTGIRAACGQFLAFIDSDDRWTPQKLSLHLQHLQNDPSVGVSFSRSAFIDHEGRMTDCYQMPKLSDIDSQHLICRNPIGNGSAPVIRRCVFNEICFYIVDERGEVPCYFDEALRRSEDIECWLRISLLTCWKIEGLSEALTHYRLNDGGLSANLYQQLQSWEHVIAKTKAYASSFVNANEQLARAFQFRYLARQAVRLGDGKAAFHFWRKAVDSDWRIIQQEPGRSSATFVAVCFLRLCPNFFSLLEKQAMRVWGMFQSLAIKVS